MDDTLTLVKEGACDDIINARGIICTTPMCWDIYRPVCGTDGVTYCMLSILNVSVNLLAGALWYLKLEKNKGHGTEMIWKY